jgi:hypothetical protein
MVAVAAMVTDMAATATLTAEVAAVGIIQSKHISDARIRI